MFSLEEFVASLFQRSVQIISVTDGQVEYLAPDGRMSASEIARFDAHRSEIAELLSSPRPSREPRLKPEEWSSCVPLTDSQFQCFYDTTGRSCIAASKLNGALDVGRLRTSIEAVVRRYTVLRSRFGTVNDSPCQWIAETYVDSFQEIELSSISESQRYAELMKIENLRGSEPVCVAMDSLFKAALFRLSTTEHVFVLELHHLISDGVSKQILAREIWEVYRHGLGTTDADLPPLVLEYADYARWQNRAYIGWMAKHADYWRTRPRGTRTSIPKSNLPLGLGAAVGAVLNMPFEAALTIKLREFAKRERTPLSLVVLSAFAATMSRWCDVRDLLVRVPLAGRDRPQLHSMVGFLSGYAYLHIGIQKGDTFLDLLLQTREEFYAAYEHQDVSMHFCPYYWSEVYFNWRPSAAGGFIDHKHVIKDSLTIEPFPLRLNAPVLFLPIFSDTAHGIAVTIHHRVDVFPAHAVSNWCANFLRLTGALVQKPGASIGAILNWDSAQ